jgi:hypothetical protein
MRRVISSISSTRTLSGGELLGHGRVHQAEQYQGKPESVRPALRHWEPPDRREATADLYYQGRQIGELSYDEGPVLLQLDTRLLEAPPRFSLDAFIQFLCAVRDDLLQPE